MAHRQRLKVASSRIPSRQVSVCAAARPATSLDRSVGASLTMQDSIIKAPTLESLPSAVELKTRTLALEEELTQMGGLAERHKLEREAERRERQEQMREAEAMWEEDRRSRAWEQVVARTHLRRRRVLDQALLRRYAARSTSEAGHPHPPQPPQGPKGLKEQLVGETKDELQGRTVRARQHAVELEKLRRRAASVRKSVADRHIAAEAESHASLRAAERKRGADEVTVEQEELRLRNLQALSAAEEQGRRLGEACEQRRDRQRAILQQGMLREADGGRLDAQTTLVGRELVRMAEEDSDVAWKDPVHWITSTHWPWRRERRVYSRVSRTREYGRQHRLRADCLQLTK